MTEIEVTCLPKDLPEYFELDISGLGLNEMLHLSDITVPDGVEIVELSHGEERDQPVVSIHVIKAAPIEEDIVEEAAEGEEGEAPEGEAAADDAGGDAEGESDDK
jgi:large subunit ribosomal protein L25